MSSWLDRLRSYAQRLRPARKRAEPPRFLDESYTAASGTRPYKLYVPASYGGRPAPLVVMLHGCTQTAADFAAGTRMNEAAGARGCLVAYPEQVKPANIARCWNWFNPADQERAQGEPAIIAGITREVMAQYAVDPRRVFIAGLSAGGAQAAIMGAAYPDLYAAIGVHSGLACGAARDLGTALSAMRRGAPGRRLATAALPRAILFQGDQDETVDIRNGDALEAQWLPADGLPVQVEQGQAPGGLGYSRRRHVTASGEAALEYWIIHGAGHAWSGGSKDGTYADPRGPNATAEMLRFFLDETGKRRSWWRS